MVPEIWCATDRQSDHSVHPHPLFCCMGQVVEPPTKFSKGAGMKGSQFLEGVAGKEGVTFLGGVAVFT